MLWWPLVHRRLCSTVTTLGLVASLPAFPRGRTKTCPIACSFQAYFHNKAGCCQICWNEGEDAELKLLRSQRSMANSKICAINHPQALYKYHISLDVGFGLACRAASHKQSVASSAGYTGICAILRAAFERPLNIQQVMSCLRADAANT